MAFDVEAAKAAGYSQAEIDAYLKDNPDVKISAPAVPGQEGDMNEPPPPTTVVTPAGEGNYMPGVATAGLAAANAAVPAAIGYGVAKYGGRAMDLARNVMQGGGASAASVPTTAPVNPAAINLGANPAVSPSYAAPAPAAPAQAQPSVLQRGMDYARQMQKIAADKVMQGARAAAPMAESAAGAARAMAPAAVGLGALTYSGGLNAGEDEELRRRRAMAPTIR